MSKKIYIVTSGEYSDYHIDSVYDTLEQAMEYVLSQKPTQYGSDYYIEEYDLNSHKPTTKLSLFKVEMHSNGTTLKIEKLDRLEYKNDIDPFSVAYLNGNRESGRVFTIICLAKDEKHAIKITNEKRTQFLALYPNVL